MENRTDNLANVSHRARVAAKGAGNDFDRFTVLRPNGGRRFYQASDLLVGASLMADAGSDDGVWLRYLAETALELGYFLELEGVRKGLGVEELRTNREATA